MLLFAWFNRFGPERVSYMKPVGQKHVMVKGKDGEDLKVRVTAAEDMFPQCSLVLLGIREQDRYGLCVLTTSGGRLPYNPPACQATNLYMLKRVHLLCVA